MSGSDTLSSGTILYDFTCLKSIQMQFVIDANSEFILQFHWTTAIGLIFSFLQQIQII